MDDGHRSKNVTESQRPFKDKVW